MSSSMRLNLNLKPNYTDHVQYPYLLEASDRLEATTNRTHRKEYIYIPMHELIYVIKIVEFLFNRYFISFS